MDKELLRIAIIATGLIVMVAMIVSAYLKNQETEEEEYEEDVSYGFDDDEYEEDFEKEPEKKPSLAQSLKNAYQQKVQQVQQQRQKLVPVVEDDDDDESDFELEPITKINKGESSHDEEIPRQPSSASPSILQFSVITKGQDDFNVADVFQVLENLGLEYGSMEVFERIGENRMVHFCVANMVEPGTFPHHDLENHYCPGVIFFMQFDEELQNPREIFDDYVSTAMLFADAMDGVVLDHRRQPLTDAMVNAIRAAI